MRLTERLLLAVGLALVGAYLAGNVLSVLFSRIAVASFDPESSAVYLPDRVADAHSTAGVDFSLWSKKRISAFEQALTQHFAAPQALLRIPKAHVEVPVFDGTDESTLNRGVGRIPGTAHPGGNGNVGIAGHRDGFFRGLKDIQNGDTVELVMQGRTQLFAVDSISIVDPSDVGVLRSEQTPSVTLVTCYPFYFIGSAPLRYIVHASLIGSEGPSPRAATNIISKPSSQSHQERTP
jgi:sortase A